MKTLYSIWVCVLCIHLNCLKQSWYNPQHNKTNKMILRPAKTQISLGICPVWSVFTVRSVGSQEPKVSSCGQRRLWSDWADAVAHIPKIFHNVYEKVLLYSTINCLMKKAISTAIQCVQISSSLTKFSTTYIYCVCSAMNLSGLCGCGASSELRCSTLSKWSGSKHLHFRRYHLACLSVTRKYSWHTFSVLSKI